MCRIKNVHHNRKIDRRTWLTGIAALLVKTTASQAKAFPDRPIKLIVPFGAGSTADILARRVGVKAGAVLGQTIYIENRPGAGGSIGAAATAAAQPDGYTLCLGTVASHAIAAAIIPHLPFDLLTDFKPVALLVSASSLIVVNSSLPVKTLSEYLDYARKKGYSLYVSGGVATTTHLLPELIRVRYNVPLEHVPAANVGNAFSDLLAGNVDMMCYPALALQPHIASGKIRPLAVAAHDRITSLPEVPTIVEALGSQEFDFSAWFGMFAPAKTPDSIITQVSSVVTAAVLGMSDELGKLGFEVRGWGPDRFDPFFRAEIPRWKEIVRITGVLDVH